MAIDEHIIGRVGENHRGALAAQKETMDLLVASVAAQDLVATELPEVANPSDRVAGDRREFEGRRYRSLTQIAREITGAHWSGPRFFGFGKRHGGSGSNRAPALLVGAVEASEITKGKQADESADELARASSKDASKNPHGRRVRCAI